MKAKKILAAAVFAAVVMFGAALAGCYGPASNGPSPETYSGVDGDGTTYSLVIKPIASSAAAKSGDSYTLTVTKSETQTSSGAVAGVSGNVLRLKPSIADDIFTIEINNAGGITEISGKITFTDRKTMDGPGRVTPGGGSGGGSSWSAVDLGAEGQPFYRESNSADIMAVAYGDGKFVAVGAYGKAAYSTDGGATWSAVTNTGFASDETISGIAWGNGKFVAVSYGGNAAYCTDPSGAWTPVDLGSEEGKPFYDIRYSDNSAGIYGIAWGNDKFVAVGDSGKAAYSPDGVTWTALDLGESGQPFCGEWNPDDIEAITYGGGKFVAAGCNLMGSSKAAYSSNGLTWTVVSDEFFNNSSQIKSIAYGNGKFVAADMYAETAYCTDPAGTWTVVNLGAGGQLGDDRFDGINGVAFGGGKFVAVGIFGDAAYSSDGASWTAADLGDAFNVYYNSYSWTSIDVNAVTYGGDRFVAAGQAGRTAYWVTP